MTIDTKDYHAACSPDVTTWIEMAIAFPRLEDRRIQVVTFANTNWPKVATLEQQSEEPLGINNYQEAVYLAWQDIASGRINLTWSKDGQFSSGEADRNKIVFGDTSSGGVALASYGGVLGKPDRLFMAWRGGGGLGGGEADGRINIAWSEKNDATTWPSENRLLLPNKCYTKPSLCKGYTIVQGFNPDNPNVPIFDTRAVLYIFWVDDNSLEVYFQRCLGDQFGDLALPPGRVQDITKLGIYQVLPDGSTQFLGEASNNPWIYSQQSFVTSFFNEDSGEIYLGGLQSYVVDPSDENSPSTSALIWMKSDSVTYPNTPQFRIFSTAQTSHYAPALWFQDIVWTGTDGNQSINIATVNDVIV
jgi:hypothetical protein